MEQANTPHHADDDFDADFTDEVNLSAEQRGDDRHEITTDGQIKLQNGFKIPIRVIDMSRSGARIRMSQFVVLPNEFDVEIYSPDRRKLKITTSARQWQRQNECGVKFLRSRTEMMPEGSF